MSISIINIKSGKPFDVYCGRKNKTYGVEESIFANPFVIGKHGDRAQVIKQYQTYFYDRIEKDMDFKNEVLKLKNKTLACWCNYPREDCHLRIIKEYLELLMQNAFYDQTR